MPGASILRNGAVRSVDVGTHVLLAEENRPSNAGGDAGEDLHPVAAEVVNGTIAGDPSPYIALIGQMRQQASADLVTHDVGVASQHPFNLPELAVRRAFHQSTSRSLTMVAEVEIGVIGRAAEHLRKIGEDVC